MFGLLGLVLTVVVIVKAKNKGYSGIAWLGAGGFIGLAVLRGMPDLDTVESGDYERRRRNGNAVGMTISAVACALAGLVTGIEAGGFSFAALIFVIPAAAYLVTAIAGFAAARERAVLVPAAQV